MTSRYKELLLPEQNDTTIARVAKALKSKNQLSPKTINNFRRVLRLGRPIPGFNKDPLRAPQPALKQHLNERLAQNPEFAHLIVEVWSETEPQLRDAVREYLDELDPEVFQVDEIDDDYWDEQIATLTEKHDDYEEDDILLMTKVCYAHVKMDAILDAKAAEEAANAEVIEESETETEATNAVKEAEGRAAIRCA